jgi:hypothetical protein
MQTHHAKGVVDAQGNLRIEAMPLLAGETVDVIIVRSKVNGTVAPDLETTSVSDPLAGIRVSTGIPDLAEHFDDYRFGKSAN